MPMVALVELKTPPSSHDAKQVYGRTEELPNRRSQNDNDPRFYNDTSGAMKEIC
jgi:hypothetical protein